MIPKKFTIEWLIHRDPYISIYEAYDKDKKQWCYIEVPNVPTSWKYTVTY